MNKLTQREIAAIVVGLVLIVIGLMLCENAMWLSFLGGFFVVMGIFGITEDDA